MDVWGSPCPCLLDTGHTLTRRRSFWGEEWYLGDSLVMKQFYLWQHPRKIFKYFRGIDWELEVTTNEIDLLYVIAITVMFHDCFQSLGQA